MCVTLVDWRTEFAIKCKAIEEDLGHEGFANVEDYGKREILGLQSMRGPISCTKVV